MLDGFKKFILRGNVVDMAVGVVIGAAFAGVVAGLTKAFLTPLIAVIVGRVYVGTPVGDHASPAVCQAQPGRV